jgi:hypothetical protein
MSDISLLLIVCPECAENHPGTIWHPGPVDDTCMVSAICTCHEPDLPPEWRPGPGRGRMRTLYCPDLVTGDAA